MTGYVDSDLTSLADELCLGGCAVSWKATLQPTIALSTTEAEYMVVTEGVQEAIWLSGLLGEIAACGGPITLY